MTEPDHPTGAARWTHADHTGDHDDLSGPHGPGDHAEPAGHDDGHAGDDMDLGPIDWTQWSVGAMGVAIGLVIAALLLFSISA